MKLGRMLSCRYHSDKSICFLVKGADSEKHVRMRRISTLTYSKVLLVLINHLKMFTASLGHDLKIVYKILFCSSTNRCHDYFFKDMIFSFTSSTNRCHDYFFKDMICSFTSSTDVMIIFFKDMI